MLDRVTKFVQSLCHTVDGVVARPVTSGVSGAVSNEPTSCTQQQIGSVGRETTLFCIQRFRIITKCNRGAKQSRLSPKEKREVIVTTAASALRPTE